MIPGSIPAITEKLLASLAAKGIVVPRAIMASAVEDAAVLGPVGKTPDPPGWKKAARGLAWDEAIGDRREVDDEDNRASRP